MYKALEVEFINGFTKAETHKISLKNPTLYKKITHNRARIYEKKIFMWHWINQNVDDFLEYLQNLRPSCRRKHEIRLVKQTDIIRNCY